jgi:hypothetical protein
VPWERLEFRRRRTPFYDVIVVHRANYRAGISYTPLCKLRFGIL